MKSGPKSVAFLLVPGFSLFTLSSAIEAFRVANERASEPPFHYVTVAIDHASVCSSDGVNLTADALLADCPAADLIFVISSLPSAEFYDASAASWLRHRAHAGSAIAALGSATVMVAKAGLLDGYSCVTHWRLHDAFIERFPRVDLVKGIYMIDRDRLTSGGGLATFDLVLAIVAREQGREVAAEIADAVLHPRIRHPGESPRMTIPSRYGVTDARVARVLEAMERRIEEPMTLEELAGLAKTSPRQLQRLFTAALGRTPHQTYAEIRLRAGRHLLQQSTVPITEAAMRCGFADSAHFTRSYHAFFGETPGDTRRALRPGSEHWRFSPSG